MATPSTAALPFAHGAACVLLATLVASSPPAPAAEKPASDVPLTKVVLFNTGVGYFEREGTVEGNARVRLLFEQQEINDLLKSLVVQDFDGGRVEDITYAAKDRSADRLGTLSVQIDDQPTLRKLLSRLQGQEVYVTGRQYLQGTIIGTETRTVEAPKPELAPRDRRPPVTDQLLNLLTKDGLQSVPFSSIRAIKLADADLDKQLREALQAVADARHGSRQTVTIHFAGRGTRRVRIGYVRETPIWKATYRLVLDKSDQALLQGWAIVENPSAARWKALALTLISGRPISFAMDLYRPLYVRRPRVAPRVFGSPAPGEYAAGDEGAAEGENGQVGFDSLMELMKTTAEPNMSRAVRRQAGPGGLAGGGVGGGAFGRRGGSTPRAGRRFDPSQGVAAAAKSREVAELFAYQIEHPVTLGGHQSALVPIVNDSIRVRRVSIYSPSIDPRHPLNGLRLTNTTNLLLTHGPITVFDQATYAGDARLPTISAGKERLISYGLDLQVQVTTTHRGLPTQLAHVAHQSGQLQITHHQQREHRFRVRNQSDAAKRVLVEFKREKGWKVTRPGKAAETAGRVARYLVEVPPSATETLVVLERHSSDQRVELADLTEQLRRTLLASPRVAGPVKERIRTVAGLQRELRDLAAQRADLTAQVAAIAEQQQRIRENMEQLDKTSPLYARYVEKLGQQEDAVEALQQQLARVDAAQTRTQTALDRLLHGEAAKADDAADAPDETAAK